VSTVKGVQQQQISQKKKRLDRFFWAQDSFPVNRTGPVGSTGPSKPDRSWYKRAETLKNFHFFSFPSLSSAALSLLSLTLLSKFIKNTDRCSSYFREHYEFSGGGAAAITAAPPPEN
jgi:hypothetical protein